MSARNRSAPWFHAGVDRIASAVEARRAACEHHDTIVWWLAHGPVSRRESCRDCDKVLVEVRRQLVLAAREEIR